MDAKKNTKYSEASTLRVFLKARALQKGTRKRNGNDPRIAPYMYFFHCLGDQEKSISRILATLAEAERDKQNAAATYH